MPPELRFCPGGPWEDLQVPSLKGGEDVNWNEYRT